MFSSIIPDILKPVSVMCGFASSANSYNADTDFYNTPPSMAQAVPANKPVSRCISHISGESTDDSTSSRQETISDEEVCARMAVVGRAARKAGRHVLTGGRLVLS